MITEHLVNYGAFGIMLLSIWLFVTRSVWPWFKAEYWPSRMDQDKRRLAVMDQISESMVALKTLAQGEDTERRQILQTLGAVSHMLSSQTGLMERLDAVIRHSLSIDDEAVTRRLISTSPGVRDTYIEWLALEAKRREEKEKEKETKHEG